MIFNGQTGEKDMHEWKRKDCIMMGVLNLVEAREWQEERAGEMGWQVVDRGFNRGWEWCACVKEMMC